MQLTLRSGLRIRYRTEGRGSPVVLLHPVAMRLEFWDAVAELLSEGHQVVALDTRGHGGSGKGMQPFSLDDLAGDVVELAAALGLGRAVFVGCSMGGMIAQGVAALAPGAVSGLVLANTAHAFDAQGRAVMAQRARDAARGLAAGAASTIERWFSPGFRHDRPETVRQVESWLLANDPEVVSWSWAAIGGLDYEGRLRSAGCPILAIAGELDPASPPAAMRRIVDAFPRASYAEMAGAGHFAPVEQPAAFAALVKTFLRSREVGNAAQEARIP